VARTEVLPDNETLRLGRRERILAEMESAGVDLLVLGREANARYVSGVPRLWLAGTRPAGVGCVIVRETGTVYLLSTWDEGVPEEIPRENLYGYTFNSANFLEVLRNVEGAESARTVAIDSLGGGAISLLSKSFPQASIVDGEEVLQRARRTKTPAEIDAMASAVRLAEECVQAAARAIAPGVKPGQVTGAFMEAMARAGVCTPSVQDTTWITSRSDPGNRSARTVEMSAGDLVAVEGGVLLDGYAGELGRTFVVGGAEAAVAGTEELFGRRDELFGRLLDACRPGEPLSGLLDAYDAAGVPAPPMPVARALGLGYDHPVVTPELARTAKDDIFEPDMVMAVTAFVWGEGVGAAYGQEPLVITESGAELLVGSPFTGPGPG
jgi:Xaa-Pro dipeptidase